MSRDGKYEFSLPRGAYMLEVRTFGQERLFAHETVFLDGGTVSVPLVLQRGYGVRGRYVLEGGGPVEMPARSVAGLPGNFFAPLDAASNVGAGAWTVKTDGSFEVTGVKGQFWVNWPAPPGMTVERVIAGGQDITDKPLDLTTGDLEGVELVVSPRPHATLTGVVAADNGRAPANVTVLLLPEDRAKVFVASPFVKNTRADATGSFVIRDVRPGKVLPDRRRGPQGCTGSQQSGVDGAAQGKRHRDRRRARRDAEDIPAARPSARRVSVGLRQAARLSRDGVSAPRCDRRMCPQAHGRGP